MLNPRAFLNHLHGPDDAIFFNVAGKTWKHKPRLFDERTDKVLKYRNRLGDDICFIVNSGGTRDKDISRINAVFVDWDCGKDADGRYFGDASVLVKKTEFQNTLTGFRPIPSAVVETRNGFHVYWFLESGVTSDKFREAQRRLALNFGGDQHVCNPARVMRLPGYDWVKPLSGLPRFGVNIISGDGIRYGLEEVMGNVPALPVLPVLPMLPDLPISVLFQSKDKDSSVEQYSTSVDGRICAHNKLYSTSVDGSRCIKKKNNTSVIVGAYPETPIAKDINTLKSTVDLAQWLTEQTKKMVKTGPTLCPFHNDTNPSAGVYRSSTGTWLFRCHSCGVRGSIIDMAMRVWGCDVGTAIKHLVGTGGDSVDPQRCQALLDLLNRNIAAINGLKKSTTPGLWRMVGRVRTDLVSKLEVAKSALAGSGEELDGQPLFFSSLRWLSGASRGLTGVADWPNRQNEKVDRYCVLGLLKKLRDQDIPAAMLKKAQEHQGDWQYRVQFYAVPGYTVAVIAEAERRAQVLTAKGCSVRGISYELIESVFSKDMADSVYPQKPKGKPGARSEFCSKVGRAVDAAIQSKGYTTTAEIQKSLAVEHKYQSVTARRIEKCLPGVLIKQGLDRRICDGPLKKQLGITAKGYPKVIVPGKGSAGTSSKDMSANADD